jgi:anti-sigma factor RsiW
MLVPYLLDELDASERAEVESLLRTRPDLAEAAERLRALLAALARGPAPMPRPELLARATAFFAPPPPHAGWLVTARRVVASIVFDSLARPAIAGFRGGSAGAAGGGGLVRHLTYASELGELDVQISATPRDTPDDAALRRIRAQIAPASGQSPGRAAVTKAPGGEVVATGPVGPDGQVLFDVPCGTYDLAVEIGVAAMIAPGVQAA